MLLTFNFLNIRFTAEENEGVNLALSRGVANRTEYTTSLIRGMDMIYYVARIITTNIMTKLHMF